LSKTTLSSPTYGSPPKGGDLRIPYGGTLNIHTRIGVWLCHRTQVLLAENY